MRLRFIARPQVATQLVSELLPIQFNYLSIATVILNGLAHQI